MMMQNWETLSTVNDIVLAVHSSSRIWTLPTVVRDGTLQPLAMFVFQIMIHTVPTLNVIMQKEESL